MQGPTSYDDDIGLQKAWTMGKQPINGDISMMNTEELTPIEDRNKKFLYARAVHVNHVIQYLMHEVSEHQRVVAEYRFMATKSGK